MVKKTSGKVKTSTSAVSLGNREDVESMRQEAERMSEDELRNKVSQFGKLTSEDAESRGIQHFFRDQVILFAGFINDFVDYSCQGHAGDVLVGKWKQHTDRGLFVRMDYTAGENMHCGVSLLQDGRVGLTAWSYDLRLDCAEGGFLSLPANNTLSIVELPRVVALAGEFMETIFAYATIYAARGCESHISEGIGKIVAERTLERAIKFSKNL